MSKISILSACFLFVLTSCERNLQDIIEDTKQATLTVYTFDEYGSPLGSGSAFFIDKNGTAITNFHVLDGATKATVTPAMSFELTLYLSPIEKKTSSNFRCALMEISTSNIFLLRMKLPNKGTKSII